MTPTLYVIGVLASFLVWWIAKRLDRYVVGHSDGGGWDSGSSYSYIPEATREESMLNDEFYPSCSPNPRIRLVALLANFIPGYVLLHLGVLLVMTIPAYVWHWLFMGERQPCAPKKGDLL